MKIGVNVGTEDGELVTRRERRRCCPWGRRPAGLRVDRCVDLRVDRCVGLRVDRRVGLRVDRWVGLRVDGRMGLRVDPAEA